MASPELGPTTCLLCGADETSKVVDKGQFDLPTHVVVCKTCGFSYLNPRWTKERYDRFYATEYDRYYRPEVLSQNDDRCKFLPAAKIVARLKERALLKPFGRVLDLGSGMGHALAYLREKQGTKATYDAIEPSATCRDHLLANGFGYLGDDVYGPWEASVRNTYGLVIMRHVLEHFPEPLPVLRKVREVLRDDGLLYVAVPDAMHPTKPLRSHFFRVVHISYFTRKSLSDMLGMAGLEVVDIVEGDRHEQHEVFAICRKGAVVPFVPDPLEHDRQMKVYRETGKNDGFHVFKSGLISVLRRFHLIR